MKRKIYIFTLILLVVLPAYFIFKLNALNPVLGNFPATLKLLFILVGVYIILLNQAVDYQKDNSNVIRFIFTAISFLPLIAFSYYPLPEIIIQTPDIIWISILISIYSILTNHTGFFSVNPTRILEKITCWIILVSFILSILAIYRHSPLYFSIWLISVILTVLSALSIVFQKKSANLR